MIDSLVHDFVCSVVKSVPVRAAVQRYRELCVHLSPYIYIIKTYGFRTSIYTGSGASAQAELEVTSLRLREVLDENVMTIARLANCLVSCHPEIGPRQTFDADLDFTDVATLVRHDLVLGPRMRRVHVLDFVHRPDRLHAELFGHLVEVIRCCAEREFILFVRSRQTLVEQRDRRLQTSFDLRMDDTFDRLKQAVKLALRVVHIRKFGSGQSRRAVHGHPIV